MEARKKEKTEPVSASRKQESAHAYIHVCSMQVKVGDECVCYEYRYT
jgi:hypothetical protein